MRVKLDEDLSHRLIAILERHQYEALTVVGQGWGGLRDSELWPCVVKERIFFITADKGFSDIRQYVPGTHAGILVLRAERDSLVAMADLLEEVLKRRKLDSLSGCIAVATPDRLRVRRTPLSG